MTDINSPGARVNTLDLALDYCDFNPGHKLFPVAAGKKLPPCFPGYQAAASNDPTQLAAWSKRYPGCSWGIEPASSGIIVLDADLKDGKLGANSLLDLELEHDTLPPTSTVRTPSGGKHFRFKATAKIAHKFRVNGFGEHLDSPHYTIMPGCIMADGGKYEYENDLPLADAPEWFAELPAWSKPARHESVETEPLSELDTDDKVQWATDYLTKDAPLAIEGNNGDATALQVCGVLKDAGISEARAIELIAEHYNERCEPPWEDGGEAKVRNAYAYLHENAPGSVRTAEADFGGDTLPPLSAAEQAEQATFAEARVAQAEGVATAKQLPQVMLAAGHLEFAGREVQRHLLTEIKKNPNAADRVFQRDGKLVRLNRNLLAGGIAFDRHYHEHKALMIVAVKPKWLAGRIERSMRFVGAPVGNPSKLHRDQDDKGKKKRVKLVSKNVSAELIGRLIENETHWDLPALFGTVEAPTLRSDGTILDQPGYDPVTGLYFDPGEIQFPAIKPNPTKAEGVAAIKKIEALLCDFPFADAKGYEGTSLAVAMAMMLTGPVRRGLDIAPAFAIDADNANEGKTTLAALAGALTVGRRIPGQTFSDSEEERRKAIGSWLREGMPILFFDNTDKATIEGDFLERMFTMPTITDRILAATETYTAPTNALVIFTANHIQVAGAMTTRVLKCRLASGKMLKERTFKHRNIVQHVIDNRPDMIAAVLTALRAFIVHGKAAATERQFRFSQWSDLIANALLWYGYTNPERGSDALQEVDPEKEQQREVIRAWAGRFGEQTVTPALLCGADTVRKAVAAAINIREADLSAHKLGRYLDRLHGTRLDLNYSVEKVPTRRARSQQWRLEWNGPDPEA